MLAVDGGNTKTIAVVADAGGRALGAGRGGCSDIYNAATPARRDRGDRGRRRRRRWRARASTAADVEAAAFSLAGADWPEDFTLLERALRERLGLPEPPLVVNDALGALRAGSPDWTGVAIVSGTYNAIGARHPDGRVFHLGFWPDRAGGRDVGDEGLRAVYHAALGMGPATTLTESALALYEAADAIALLHEFTRRGGLAESEVDRLAPVVLDAADAGDAVAQAIVADKGSILGRQGRASAEQLGLPLAGTRIVLIGGVFAHPTERLADATMAELPGAIPIRPLVPAVTGALLLALDRLGVDGRRGRGGRGPAVPRARRKERRMGGIALEGVSKVFPGDVVAVDDVDLEIGDGEFMVLVGPSGCGKSTLLRMVAGLEGVSSGTIRIGERDVTELAPRSRDIAMVFQNYALYPNMRVWDNLAFALKLRRTPKPAMRERVDDVAGVLGLRELIDRKPGALSGGQRQRVAMGRAMVREPQAYLMDEPLSNLDAKLRVGMRAELARLHERLGVTTIYVTHDQVEAMTLGDRVAVLRDGTVQQCDTPERLFEAPANVFVAAFIGSPAMNLAPGELRDGRLRVAGIEIPLAGGAAARGARDRGDPADGPAGPPGADDDRARRGCGPSWRWSSGSAPRAT